MTAISPPSALARLAAAQRRWSRTPLSFRIGSVILAIHLSVALIGAVWTPFGYQQIMTGEPLSGVSWAHLFGTDQLGRDVLSRVMYGAHIELLVSMLGTVLGAVVGAAIGLLCGYLRGWIDESVMRFFETLISIPFLVLALLVVSMAGPERSGNPVLVVLVIAFIFLPRVGRLARAAALDIATRDYIIAARLRGERSWSIVRREILPNATSVLFVEFSLRAGYAPVLVGSLGFLGFGLRPPTPEWGLMISEYRILIQIDPTVLLGPGLALATLVVGLNLCTEGLARMLGRTFVVKAT
jgi:peptide/nickel transport system permease protein